jgi:hypothetical protein
MAIRKRYHILACTLALTAVIAYLAITSRTKQDSDQEWKKGGGWGSAEEAFTIASRTVEDYLSTLDSGPVVISPQFRATLLSQSKLWTIKGYASCRQESYKSYQWTVILNYHDMQEWEVLAKIVTPEFTTSDHNQVMGIPEAEGKLFQTHHGN